MSCDFAVRKRCGWRNRQGLILIAVLWILFILVLLAFGLGRLGSGEMSLMQLSLGQTRAYAAARAGVIYAENLLIKNPSQEDTLGAVGVKLLSADLEKTFRQVALGDSSFFSIGTSAGLFYPDGKVQKIWGIEDEAGRLNLNSISALDSAGAYVFADLVDLVEPGTGRKLLSAVVAFRQNVGKTAEIRTFNFPEELLMVDGMSPELFKRFKNYLTVLPRVGTEAFRVNVYTAPADVVRAVFSGIARQGKIGGNPATDAEAFLRCRAGLANGRATALSCNVPTYLSGFDVGPFRSGVYRIRSVGGESNSAARSVIEAVVDTGESGKVKILSWHRE